MARLDAVAYGDTSRLHFALLHGEGLIVFASAKKRAEYIAAGPDRRRAITPQEAAPLIEKQRAQFAGRLSYHSIYGVVDKGWS